MMRAGYLGSVGAPAWLDHEVDLWFLADIARGMQWGARFDESLDADAESRLVHEHVAAGTVDALLWVLGPVLVSPVSGRRQGGSFPGRSGGRARGARSCAGAVVPLARAGLVLPRWGGRRSGVHAGVPAGVLVGAAAGETFARGRRRGTSTRSASESRAGGTTGSGRPVSLRRPARLSGSCVVAGGVVVEGLVVPAPGSDGVLLGGDLTGALGFPVGVGPCRRLAWSGLWPGRRRQRLGSVWLAWSASDSAARRAWAAAAAISASAACGRQARALLRGGSPVPAVASSGCVDALRCGHVGSGRVGRLVASTGWTTSAAATTSRLDDLGGRCDVGGVVVVLWRVRRGRGRPR